MSGPRVYSLLCEYKLQAIIGLIVKSAIAIAGEVATLLLSDRAEHSLECPIRPNPQSDNSFSHCATQLKLMYRHRCGKSPLGEPLVMLALPS